MSPKSIPVLLLLLTLCTPAHAAGGIQPTEPIVLVEEAKRVSSTTLMNDADEPLLLVTQLYGLPDEDTLDLTASPKLVRVDPGARQLVRFVLQLPPGTALGRQHLMRVRFEGVPRRIEGTSARMNTAHDLPVLIHPKDLKLDLSPWTHLNARRDAQGVVIENPSRYVMRFAPQVRLEPAGTLVSTGATYLLPGKRLAVPDAGGAQRVVLFPVGVYGETAPEFAIAIGDAVQP